MGVIFKMTKPRTNELELLKLAAEKYDYNPDTGVFTYRTGRKSDIGKIAGNWWHKNFNNHSLFYNILNLVVKGKRFQIKAHRLAWFIVYGEMPDFIDHIKHATSKDYLLNRISNLRAATTRENASNLHKKTSSKYTGVSWHVQKGKWQAKIKMGKKEKYLGLFKDEKEAAKAYQDAVMQL
tara:strand:- start:3404 stop:3943 length:540 start_codon:yes stop_codon:yes gene_type:complete